MNLNEKRMLEILRELRSNHNVIAIKAEFEAEGTRTDEMVKLNEVVFRADMDLFVKIGGCEAVRDMDQCRILGASGIMAPMVETPFALEKFLGAINKVYTKDEQKEIEFIINAETKTCYDNFEDILSIPGADTIGSIAVGRVDLTASYGYGRDMINSDFIYERTRKFLEIARDKGVTPGMGGGVSLEAIPFIRNLGDVVKKFETRKVVFKYSDDLNIAEGLLLAMEFEILYLKNKHELYKRMAEEDLSRIKMMEDRFENMKETLGK